MRRETESHYFRKYPRIVISGDELLVVSGIQEYARRIRELRVQFGWSIASGVTIKEMYSEGEFEAEESLQGMTPSQYMLLRDNQDRDAAHRWNVAKRNPQRKTSVRIKS